MLLYQKKLKVPEPPEAVIFTDASAIPSQDAGVINESKIVTNCSTQISPSLNSKPRFSSAPNADNISMSLKVDVIVISAQSPLPPIGLKQILNISEPLDKELPKTLNVCQSIPTTPIAELLSV